jgi:hypothetical protein
MVDTVPKNFIAPATTSRMEIHVTGLSFRNEAQRNEESIFL